jgi:hypothetical protein
MREGMGQPGQRHSCHWKSIESWVWTKYLVFCSDYNVPLFFENYKKVFSVQRAWHSPNTLPKMAHGQDFRIITWNLPRPHPRIERGLLSVTWRRVEQLCWCDPLESSLVSKGCVNPITISSGSSVGLPLYRSQSLRQLDAPNSACFFVGNVMVEY